MIVKVKTTIKGTTDTWSNARVETGPNGTLWVIDESDMSVRHAYSPGTYKGFTVKVDG